MKPSFPPGIGLRTFANSPETKRISASFEDSVRLVFFGGVDFAALFGCCASAARTGRTEMLSPEAGASGDFRNSGCKKVSLGKSAAASARRRSGMENQWNIAERAHPGRPWVFYDAASPLSSGVVEKIRGRPR